MFIPHYSIDSFNVSSDVTSMITAPLTSGRAIFALWGALFKVLSFNPVTGQFFGMLVLVGSCAVGHCNSLSNIIPLSSPTKSLAAAGFMAGFIYLICQPIYCRVVLLCRNGCCIQHCNSLFLCSRVLPFQTHSEKLDSCHCSCYY